MARAIGLSCVTTIVILFIFRDEKPEAKKNQNNILICPGTSNGTNSHPSSTFQQFINQNPVSLFCLSRFASSKSVFTDSCLPLSNCFTDSCLPLSNCFPAVGVRVGEEVPAVPVPECSGQAEPGSCPPDERCTGKHREMQSFGPTGANSVPNT